MRSTAQPTARIASLLVLLSHIAAVLSHRRRHRARSRRALERLEADEISYERYALWATRIVTDDFHRSNALVRSLEQRMEGTETIPKGLRLTRAEAAVLQPVWSRLRKRLQASRAESQLLLERVIRATFGPDASDQMRAFRAMARGADHGQYRERLPETVSYAAIRSLILHFVMEECARSEFTRLALKEAGVFDRA